MSGRNLFNSPKIDGSCHSPDFDFDPEPVPPLSSESSQESHEEGWSTVSRTKQRKGRVSSPDIFMDSEDENSPPKTFPYVVRF